MLKIVTKTCLFILISTFFCFAQKSKQGKERWDVKTMTDSLFYKVDSNSIPVMVRDINNIPRPKNIYNKTGRLQEEMQCFTIECKIIDFILEDDGDYHLMVTDVNGSETMIVELVKPSYINKQYYLQAKKARDTFNYYKRKKLLLSKTFVITGVIFFDLPHNQKGAAANYLELHPVLKFYIK
mgnify:CR=1 FL=1